MRREHGVPSAWRLGGLSVRELGLRVWDRAGADQLLHRAGALSYSFLFSIFPALLFVLAVLRMVHVHHVIRELMDYATTILPGDAAATVRSTLRRVVTTSGRPSLVSVSALMALWFGSTGLASVMTALNAVHAVKDDRPWWKRRAVAMLLTAAFSLFLILSVVLLMGGARIGAALAAMLGLGPVFLLAWNGVRILLAVFLIVTAIELVYHFAPAVSPPWRSVTPGAITATALGLLASYGLRLYVGWIAHYDVTYGSIAGVILLLLWLYLTSLALLVGAEVDVEITRAMARRAADRVEARAVGSPKRRDRLA